jgi:hypothetical protein
MTIFRIIFEKDFALKKGGFFSGIKGQRFATLPARRALQLGKANPSFHLRQGYEVTSWRIRGQVSERDGFILYASSA